jgi:hypothetical protein
LRSPFVGPFVRDRVLARFRTLDAAGRAVDFRFYW